MKIQKRFERLYGAMELKDKDLITILKKMGTYVNASKDYFDPVIHDKPMPKNWFLQYAWPEEDEHDFGMWLNTFLEKKLKYDPLTARRYTEFFLLDYGWTYTKKDKAQLFAEGYYKRRVK